MLTPATAAPTPSTDPFELKQLLLPRSKHAVQPVRSVWEILRARNDECRDIRSQQYTRNDKDRCVHAGVHVACVYVVYRDYKQSNDRKMIDQSTNQPIKQALNRPKINRAIDQRTDRAFSASRRLIFRLNRFSFSFFACAWE